MKTKKFKRVLTLVLALAMMLSLSMVAFATGDEVSVIVRYRDYDTNSNTYSIPVQLDSFNSELSATNTNVYTVVNGEYENTTHNIVWNPTGNSPVHYLEGLTFNGIDYLDERIEAAASCYNDDDEYEGGNAIIDSLNELPEFIACDGVYMSMAMLMEDESLKGYYIMGDMQHMCSITKDWIFEVDYASDGYGNFVYPPNFTDISALSAPYGSGTDLLTMDECVLHDGDIVRLTYQLIWTIFE